MTRPWHNPYTESDRFPQGAMPVGSFVRLRLRVYGGCERAYVRMWKNNREELYPMRPLTGGGYEAMVPVGKSVGLVWYYFIIDTARGRVFAGKPEGETCGEFAFEPPSFQITVYDPAFSTPEWMRKSIMMQIMVDRFHIGGKAVKPHGRGAYLHASWDEAPEVRLAPKGGDCEAIDFFGGNLKGVLEKLAYIKSLGVNALYFNPIFRARSNHKYDTGDYMEIDPSFGTNAEFDELMQALKDEGMHVVLDGVFSHTGADSRYFNKFKTYEGIGAYQSAGSKYASWYRFGKDRDDYDAWWGFDTLPNVNELDPKYLDFIVRGKDAVAAHYIKRGTSGWRLDVADELPMDFIRQLRQRVKAEGRENAVIGEVWEDPSNKIAYGKLRSYALGDTLDSTMNYPLRSAVIDFFTGKTNAYQLSEIINHQMSTLPRPMMYSMMNLLGSHDRPRIINMLSGNENLEPEREKRAFIPLSKEEYALGKKRFVKAWELVCHLPGMPCLYYGDEAGLTGMGDPFCRMPYPWGKEDEELRERIREINMKRVNDRALTLGEARVNAKNADTIEIKRMIRNGEDAFGKKAEDKETVFTLKRE
ncbi:MAG: glycoside hydrolase family 13 protein [Clostridia bacterium]|nr:glycoside hydrolase family 13 protein [Clostridia bacterium]